MPHDQDTGRPRVIIIGAGVSGMATGCYAQMSGADTVIFEKHVLPGGCCTAWARDGYILDYCTEWLIGTAAGTEMRRHLNEIERSLSQPAARTAAPLRDVFKSYRSGA